MRISLNEIKQIEDHLNGELDGQEEALFQARLLLYDQLKSSVWLQEESYAVIKNYGRKMLRKDIETVERKLFNDKEHQNFKRRILSIFKSK